MESIDGVSAAGGVLLGGVGVLLLLLSLWFRWGTSRVARWWVRRVPAERMSFLHSSTEALALGVAPFSAQLCLAVSAVLMLRVHPVSRDAAFSPVAWFVLCVEVLMGIVVLVTVSNRYVLPLWLYPAWLRPQRRADREDVPSR